MLKATPGLRPVTILGEMQRRDAPFSADLRRALERRIRMWQALHGPEGEVILRRSIRRAGRGCRISPMPRR